jgi:hypothetical protein
MPRRTTRTDFPPPPRPLADQAAAELPVLAGVLSVESGRHGEPVLLLTVRCPACRGPHRHSWSPDAAGSHPRTPHCWRPDSPYWPGGYCITAADTAFNRAVLREFARQRQQWLAGPRRRPHLLVDLTGSPLVEIEGAYR